MGIYNMGISGLDIVTQIDVFIVFKGYFNTHDTLKGSIHTKVKRKINAYVRVCGLPLK